MTLKEPKPKMIHKPIGTVIEAGERNILYLLVFTCHYLYQLSNEILSLVRLTNQINVMVWASHFWPDWLPDCEFCLLFSALNYWMSLLFTLLLLRIKKIKWRRRRCCVWLRRLTKFRGRETAFIVPARRVCIKSIQAREFVICSCISVPNSPPECKYTAWFSRLVIVLQFVFILCPKLRWFPASKWVKFVPKSLWIDLPTVRQQ